jgi:hypothetical protein
VKRRYRLLEFWPQGFTGFATSQELWKFLPDLLDALHRFDAESAIWQRLMSMLIG